MSELWQIMCKKIIILNLMHVLVLLCEPFITMQDMDSFYIRYSIRGTWTGFSSLMHETSKTRAETKTSVAKWLHCCVHKGQLHICKSCLINSNLDSEYVNWSGVTADRAGVFPLRTHYHWREEAAIWQFVNREFILARTNVYGLKPGHYSTTYILTSALQMIKSHWAHASA